MEFLKVLSNAWMHKELVWILLQIHSVASLITFPDLSTTKCYVKEGDVNIGVITQVYEPGTGDLYCGNQLQNDRVLQAVEAVVWAVDEINRKGTLLPGIDLGYVILDNCGEKITAIAQAMAFVKEANANQPNTPASQISTCQPRDKQFNVIGVIGLEDSDVAQSVSNVMALFNISVLSTLGTNHQIMEPSRKYHDYLFYMTPADQLQGKAMVALMKHFGWTYSALIYSEGVYGEQGAKYIERLLGPNDTCLAMIKELKVNAQLHDFQHIFNELDTVQKARAVLLFLSKEHTRSFFEVVKRNGLENQYIWIGSDTLTSFTGAEVSGAFSVTPKFSVSNQFRDYYKRIIETPTNNRDNPWMNELWAVLHNCSWTSTDPQLSCNNQAISSVNQEVSAEASAYIDAVNVLAEALNAYISTSCNNAFNDKSLLSRCINGRRLLPYIKNVSFLGQSDRIQFGKNGNVLSGFQLQYFENNSNHWSYIGDWNGVSETIRISEPLKINWESYIGFSINDNEIPRSVCSLPCTVKEYKVLGSSSCCWECKRCKANEIIVGNSICEDCPPQMWPDSRASMVCEDLEDTYLDWGDSEAIPLWFCSIIGMIGCVIVGVFYFIKRDNKLIKASNLELSAITLAGAFLTYMTMLVMMGKPNTGRCAMERFGFDNALAILVVPLMVKVNRSFRIYQASKKGNKDVVFIGRTSQLAFCIGVLLMQIILATLSMVVVPPEAKRGMPYPETEGLVELHCHMPVTGLILPLLFNLVMVLLCGYFGFSVFKVPDNYYESRCICISACLTWILWLCFMPTYFSAKYQVSKTISLEVCLLFNATLVLFIIFLPKLYAAYFVKEDDLKLTVNVIKTHPSQEISGLSERRVSGSATDSRRHSGNHLQVGSPVASTANGGDHGSHQDENAIMAAYIAKSGRRRSSAMRAIRKMDMAKITSAATVQETETPDATTSST